MRARLAADIGGTFTDVVLESPAGRDTAKVLTTPAPEVGVLEGVRRVLAAAGLPPSEVSVFVHGTTLATNALIERKGARTAFVTTEGMRDILEMGYEKRFEQYDVYMERPLPLVPRPLRFTVPGRRDGRGRVLRELDEAAVRAVGERPASRCGWSSPGPPAVPCSRPGSHASARSSACCPSIWAARPRRSASSTRASPSGRARSRSPGPIGT